MKIMFDLNKSLDKTKLVQVQRTVQSKNGQYTRMQWVKPSDVKDADKVIGGQQDSMEISEKNFPVGSKIYYKGEEATVQRVGKEFSGGGMGIVVRFSKGGTGTIGKSDMKNVSKTPPKKLTSSDSTDSKSVDDPRYKNGNLTRTVDKSGLSSKYSEPKKSDTITVKGKTFKAKNGVITVSMYDLQERLNKVKKFAKDNGYKVEYAESKKNNSDSVPDKAVGKTWSDTKTELGKMRYKVDSIFSSQPPQPKEKLTLYKDDKKYEAEVTKYHNGDYEILGSSIKEVKKDDTKKGEPDKSNKKDLVEESDKLIAMMDQIRKQTKWTSNSKLLDAFDDAANTGEGVTEEHEVDSVQVTKVEEYKGNGPNGPGTVDRIRVTAEVTGKTSSGKTFTKEMSISTKKVGNDSPSTKSDADSGKFSMSEFNKVKSDHTKAIQYLKDNGISWKETDNEGINWMRACMAASRAENLAQGATKKDSASKSSTDTKASGKSAEDAKKAVKDLLSANNNDRAKVMQRAKASGVTWKESDNDGINWMRASLAIQKHYESGKTISVSDSKPTHDNPLVTTETKSGKPYQIWESNGRIYGSLPGKQDSRNVRDIRDFTSSGFETLDEVKDYIKKYF